MCMSYPSIPYPTLFVAASPSLILQLISLPAFSVRELPLSDSCLSLTGQPYELFLSLDNPFMPDSSVLCCHLELSMRGAVIQNVGDSLSFWFLKVFKIILKYLRPSENKSVVPTHFC